MRSLQNVLYLSTFTRFVRLCAGRIGSPLNLTSLASDCGVAVNTAKAWISVLEASYVVYLLPPHHQNFSKRLIKSPKLYFYDTGVACSLLGLRTAEQVETHYLWGSLFENLVVTEILKHYDGQGQVAPLYFWQDKTGREVDLLLEQPGGELLALEVKAGFTLSPDYFRQLNYWRGLSGTPAERAYVVYAGTGTQATAQGTYLPLADLPALLREVTG